ncbi:hypothetical protein ACIBJC_33800 [Streptomyces sp. NPDC050509]|uniref:hypothetical protein n=1 Tax=Streptomyces sp. NPDC050509 TaxID=3365620 RepID=UPI0037A77AE9
MPDPLSPLAGDTLPRDVLIDRVRAGDLIVLPYAGSYDREFVLPRISGVVS